MSSNGLQTYLHTSSEKGLSSVIILIVGNQAAVIIDPPFLVPDADPVVRFVKDRTSVPVKAVFVIHHHPDHFFNANPILGAVSGSKLFAAPHVCAGIDREFDEKVTLWRTVFGRENIRQAQAFPPQPVRTQGQRAVTCDSPRTPPGRQRRPHVLLAPTEKTIICGDVVYARSTHVWVEEVKTKAILEAWYKSLDLIVALLRSKVIPGRLGQGWEPDTKADLAHNRKNLDLFAEKITYGKQKPQVDELFQTSKAAFPQAEKNLDFFLGHLSNRFGEGGKVWEEKCHHNAGARTKEQVQAFYFTA